MSTLLLFVIAAKLRASDYETSCLMQPKCARLGEANSDFENFEKKLRVQ
jgi:hypothetical protein